MCLRTRSAPAPTRPLRSRTASLVLIPALLAPAAPAAAAEPCKLGHMAELPVTMRNMRPLVHAAINGKDALFIADSGAFFSSLTPAGAKQFNLRPDTVWGMWADGVGGSSMVAITTVKTFRIFNMDLPNIPFYVLGNDVGSGAVGLLGQNVFRIGDVEYDLANGVINILRTRGACSKSSLAYWANAGNLPYSEIDVDSATREKPHTTGEAYVNGRRIRVMFDTGAWSSLLALDAARRAGVTPDSPGVRPGGMTSGIGHRLVPSWIGPFASFKIGDEEIRNTHLRFGDLQMRDTDMLIGADFFLSHHILVASSQRKLYFTYNGGPVFNLTTVPVPATATAAAGEPGVPSDATAAPQALQAGQLDAAGYARRGSASAARREYASALADLSRAIELDPTQAEYFYERGSAYAVDNQADKALEDYGQAITLKPDDVQALMARAALRAQRNDPAEAIGPDLDAAARAAPREGDMRLALGDLYQRVRNYPAAIAQYDDWIASHRDDVHMARARSARCRARALAGQGLDQALGDCNFAVRKDAKAAAFLDSRGLVYLRLGQYDKALSDYDAALALNPRIAWSLYGRGVAKQRLGRTAAGQADIAAAEALAPRIAEQAASHGIVP
jgi:tetratricopeptide (TPR) repeat protein